MQESIMEILTNIPIELDTDALMKKMYIEPGCREARDFEDLIRKASQVARPKALYKESYVDARGDDSVTIDGVTFRSRALRKNLDKVERVFPYVATCGHELDELVPHSGDILEQFWLDTIKATLLDITVHHLNERIDRKYKLAKASTMSPGAGDVSVWPIEQQEQLFLLLGDVESHIGVKLTKNSLMVPNKTVSGIRFPTEVDFRTCQLCRRKNCPLRNAPFDRELWESIGLDDA